MNKSTVGLFVLAALVAWIAWFVPREQFLLLFGVYALAFGFYFWLIRQDLSDRIIFWIGVLMRILVLFSLPQLSNDVYRFVWDGRLLVAGADPFVLRPSEWMAMANPPAGINQELHDLIYADNYTVYPPIHQAIFWLSARLSTSIVGSILVLKSVLVLGEIALLWLLRKAKQEGIFPVRLLAIYALNPLVVLEIAGNGHFEGLMVLFLVLGIYGLRKNDGRLVGVGFGLAVAVKLIPLILLGGGVETNGRSSVHSRGRSSVHSRGRSPVHSRGRSDGHPCGHSSGHSRGRSAGLKGVGWGLGINLILWMPFFLMGSMGHMMDSIWLYFESFEFNGSFFYLLKWLSPKGWRIGLITNGLTIIIILVIAFRQKELEMEQKLLGMAIIWSVYLLNSAIVHPWYVIPVLVLSALANRWYGVIWTFLIYLSYSHYWRGEMTEQYWIIALEYILLLGFIYWDFAKAHDKEKNH